MSAFPEIGMSRRICIAVLAAITAVCGVPGRADAAEAESLSGEWIGRIDLGSEPAFLRITIADVGANAWTASLVLQPLSAMSPSGGEARRISESWRNAPVTRGTRWWRFTAGAGADLLRLDARRTTNGTDAVVTFRSHTARTRLHHLATVDVSREREYVGAYVLPSGDRIFVWRPSTSGPIVGGIRSADGFLTYLEEATGRSGNLYPIDDAVYITGPTSVLPDPVRVRATFRKNPGGGRELIWRVRGRREIVATLSPAHRREAVQLRGPGGLIGCDLLTPSPAGRHPAAVLVPGAGANTRDDMYLIAQVFAAHGVAALTCDKRGTGTSEGDWRLTSFQQQAADVAAGLAFLRQRSGIDPERVGVFALSEGAWVAPITVAETPGIGFLILAGAPATSRRESVLIGNAERLEREGTSQAEVARYREFFHRYQQAIMDTDAAAIDVLWREYARASWLPANKPTSQTLNDWSWQRARLTWPYEPGPMLSRVTCPVLAIWGSDDESFPPAIHSPRLEESMRAARNPDYTLRVIPRANHSFHLVAPSFLAVTGYAPEYLQVMVQWLTRVTGTRARR
jgi:pimeloyl-ACP methyl ester carboxylesterase